MPDEQGAKDPLEDKKVITRSDHSTEDSFIPRQAVDHPWQQVETEPRRSGKNTALVAIGSWGVVAVWGVVILWALAMMSFEGWTYERCEGIVLVTSGTLFGTSIVTAITSVLSNREVTIK
jgi:hypothetical protein